MAFLFVYSYLLYYVVFYNQLSKIKQQVALIQHTSGYADQYTTTLSFKKGVDGFIEGQLTWLEEDEFRFKDKLFDILSIEETNDSICFYCRIDEDENRLMTQLEECLTGSIKSERLGGKMSFKPTVLIRDFLCLQLTSDESYFSNQQEYQSRLSFYYSSCDLTIESPPPSFLFFSSFAA
ncbi:MAG: hypothetical protein H7282_00335 [Cytophagaceae bacterium]|nr:hypothetical protein [Cytophagaceae bacterium]